MALPLTKELFVVASLGYLMTLKFTQMEKNQISPFTHIFHLTKMDHRGIIGCQYKKFLIVKYHYYYLYFDILM